MPLQWKKESCEDSYLLTPNQTHHKLLKHLSN